MDKGISGTAELSVLTVKWENLGRGRELWDAIPGWPRGKNGALTNSNTGVAGLCRANLSQRLAGTVCSLKSEDSSVTLLGS